MFKIGFELGLKGLIIAFPKFLAFKTMVLLKISKFILCL